MNSNAAAFALILQQRRDLAGSQHPNPNPLGSSQYRGHSPRPVNSSSSYQQPQYAAPACEQFGNIQHQQQPGNYNGNGFSQNHNAIIHQQPIHNVSYSWQQPQQQQPQHQQWQQQDYPSGFNVPPPNYPPSSAPMSMYGLPSTQYQPQPVGSYNQQQLSQFQSPYQVTNNIASTLNNSAYIGSQYAQSSGMYTPQIVAPRAQNHSKNKTELSGKSACLPEPQLFYCEGCEKEFTQKTAYDAHCANHEKCRHPGCDFSGTKAVVIAHFHGAHGMYSGEGYKMIEVEGSKKKYRVLLGVSPEEIEKWRMERRKNFPTAENALKKKEERELLRKAGGLIHDKEKKRKRSDNETKSKYSPADVSTGGGEGNGLVGSNCDDDSTQQDGDTERNKDDDKDKDKDNKLRKKPCVFFVKGMCKQGDQCTYSHDFEIKVCNFFVRSGRCSRGNRCTFAHDKIERAKFIEERKNGGDKKNKETGDDTESGAVDLDDEDGNPKKKKITRVDSMKEKEKTVHKKVELNDDDLRARTMKRKGQLFLPKPFAGGTRGTLLRNLLLQEVEAEENIILQCLRLLVNNNFLMPSS